MGIRSIHDQIRTVEMNAKNRDQLELIPDMVKQVESVVSSAFNNYNQKSK